MALEGRAMSLRDEAIQAMGWATVDPPHPHKGTQDDPHNSMEAALDGLLGWLRGPHIEAALTQRMPSHVRWSTVITTWYALCDLLGGDE